MIADKIELNALLANVPLGHPRRGRWLRPLPRLRRWRLLHRPHLHHRRRPHPQLSRAITPTESYAVEAGTHPGNLRGL
jgi:hypothetical protein